MKQIVFALALVAICIATGIWWISSAATQSLGQAQAFCDLVKVGENIQTLEELTREAQPELITVMGMREKKHWEFKTPSDFKTSELGSISLAVKVVFKTGGPSYSICSINADAAKVVSKNVITSR